MYPRTRSEGELFVSSIVEHGNANVTERDLKNIRVNSAGICAGCGRMRTKGRAP